LVASPNRGAISYAGVSRGGYFGVQAQARAETQRVMRQWPPPLGGMAAQTVRRKAGEIGDDLSLRKMWGGTQRIEIKKPLKLLHMSG